MRAYKMNEADMINEFFVPELKEVDVDDVWFPQDATANEIIILLKETFGERIVSWTCGVYDFVFMYSLVYADIHHDIADIRPQLLQKVAGNSVSLLAACHK